MSISTLKISLHDQTRASVDAAVESIVKQLCEVAAEEANAQAEQARVKAEDAAAREMTEVRARTDALRVDLEQRLAKVEQAAAEAARTLADVQAQSAAARTEFDQRLAQSEKTTVETSLALAEAERAAASAKQEVAATVARLADAERAAAAAQQDAAGTAARLAEAERQAAAAQQDAAGTAGRLAEAERQVSAAQHEAASISARLKETMGRIDAIDRERSEAILARDVAEAHLEGEVNTRTALAAELESLRDRAQNTTAISSDTIAALDQVRAAMHALNGAADGRGLLDALLELVALNFARVALCTNGPHGFLAWGSRGFDPPLPRKTPLEVMDDSVLARASADWKLVTVNGHGGHELSGLSGARIGHALALPIVSRERGSAILYAENPPDSATDPETAAKIAELLADHVRNRLRIKMPPPSVADAPKLYSPARQARRLRMQDGATIAVDDSESAFVDVSTLGAQVLSPRPIRPNSDVRLRLPDGNGGVPCNGRVVWVMVEPPREDAGPLYRAGVEFTSGMTPELEAFFLQHGLVEPTIRH